MTNLCQIYRYIIKKNSHAMNKFAGKIYLFHNQSR